MLGCEEDYNEPLIKLREGSMKMQFTLAMEDLVVSSREIDQMTMTWQDEVTQEQVLEMSGAWISSPTFLTDHMAGLTKVGESSLTIQPVA